MRYRCIQRRRHQYPVRMMCRLLRISRSGYYAWCARDESLRAQRDRALQQCIQQVHLESRGVYGAREIHQELMAGGEPCGRHKVARLMRAAGLKGCPKRRFRARPEQASRQDAPTSAGLPTSPSSPRARAGCIWLWSWTCTHGGSWAGPWIAVSGGTWSLTQ